MGYSIQLVDKFNISNCCTFSVKDLYMEANTQEEVLMGQKDVAKVKTAHTVI